MTDMINVILTEKNGAPEDAVFKYKVELDGKEIGICQLRSKTSKGPHMPAGFENNVYCNLGYYNNYWKEVLPLLIMEAKQLKLTELRMATTDENKDSQVVIESNGGILLDKQKDTDGVMQRIYKISL